MSPTTIADPVLIPDIEAFEERVAIHIHDGAVAFQPTKPRISQRRPKASEIRRTTGRG